MMARALEQRWSMSPQTREDVISALSDILTCSTTSPREKISAAKALISAEKQNQDDQHKAIDFALNTGHDRISAIANNLGIDPALVIDATTETVGDSESIKEYEGFEAGRQRYPEEAGHVVQGSGGSDSSGGEFGSSDSLPG
jgi:hypothetical protein